MFIIEIHLSFYYYGYMSISNLQPMYFFEKIGIRKDCKLLVFALSKCNYTKLLLGAIGSLVTALDNSKKAFEKLQKKALKIIHSEGLFPLCTKDLETFNLKEIIGNYNFKIKRKFNKLFAVDIIFNSKKIMAI